MPNPWEKYAAPSTEPMGPWSNYSSITPITIPEPSDTGVWSGIKRGVGNIVHTPAAILDAITKPPQNEDEEKMQTLGGTGALAIHRLIAEPMAQQHQLANKYQKEATSSTDTPPPEFGFDFSLTGRTPQEKAQHLANLHNIASAVPILGPMAADMTERFLGIGAHEGKPDKSGAMAEGASYIAAPKVAEGVIKGVPVVAKATAEALPESVTSYTPSGNLGKLAARTGIGTVAGEVPILRHITNLFESTRAPTLKEWWNALQPDKQMSLFKSVPKLGDTPISPETHPATFEVLKGNQTVGSAAAAEADTAAFAKAKAELGPDATISQVAQRAQQIKQSAATEGLYGQYSGRSNLKGNLRQMSSPTAAASPNPTVPKQPVTFVPKETPSIEDLHFQDQNMAAILQAALGQLRLKNK